MIVFITTKETSKWDGVKGALVQKISECLFRVYHLFVNLFESSVKNLFSYSFVDISMFRCLKSISLSSTQNLIIDGTTNEDQEKIEYGLGKKGHHKGSKSMN